MSVHFSDSFGCIRTGVSHGYEAFQKRTYMNTQFQVNQNAEGVLFPDAQGPGTATVTWSADPVNGQTAIVNFAGMNQVLVYFDATGTQPVGYTVLNQMADPRSIENMVYHLPQLVH